MNLHKASLKLTPCEYIRKINDLAQSDSENDKKIREYCFNAEKGAKWLADKLYHLSPNIWQGIWKINESFAQDFVRRIKPDYKYYKGDGDE